MSLKNNLVAKRWTTGYGKIPIGVEGMPVILSGVNYLPGSFSEEKK